MSVSLEEFEQETYVLTPKEITSVSSITQLSIRPIIIKESGKKLYGSILSTYYLSAGSGEPPVNPPEDDTSPIINVLQVYNGGGGLVDYCEGLNCELGTICPGTSIYYVDLEAIDTESGIGNYELNILIDPAFSDPLPLITCSGDGQGGSINTYTSLPGSCTFTLECGEGQVIITAEVFNNLATPLSQTLTKNYVYSP